MVLCNTCAISMNPDNTDHCRTKTYPRELQVFIYDDTIQERYCLQNNETIN